MVVCNTILYDDDCDDYYSKDNHFNAKHEHTFANRADIETNANIEVNVGYVVNKTIDKTTCPVVCPRISWQ